uniref:Uncharacterized protein n=1 Tax=Mycena chlorophos TaxID=658473 RepID=A0ABQ0LNE3_MYCCL|nr:predicted protein [Mycena chlorophos]
MITSGIGAVVIVKKQERNVSHDGMTLVLRRRHAPPTYVDGAYSPLPCSPDSHQSRCIGRSRLVRCLRRPCSRLYVARAAVRARRTPTAGSASTQLEGEVWLAATSATCALCRLSARVADAAPLRGSLGVPHTRREPQPDPATATREARAIIQPENGPRYVYGLGCDWMEDLPGLRGVGSYSFTVSGPAPSLQSPRCSVTSGVGRDEGLTTQDNGPGEGSWRTELEACTSSPTTTAGKRTDWTCDVFRPAQRRILRRPDDDRRIDVAVVSTAVVRDQRQGALLGTFAWREVTSRHRGVFQFVHVLLHTHDAVGCHTRGSLSLISHGGATVAALAVVGSEPPVQDSRGPRARACRPMMAA